MGLVVAEDVGCDVVVVDADASRAEGGIAIASSGSHLCSH